MIVLRKGSDVPPFPMWGVIVSIDGAIHMLPVPVMSKAALLDFRPPEVNVAVVDEERAQFGVDRVGIDDDICKFLPRNEFQPYEINH
jgi:hypothetical protein